MPEIKFSNHTAEEREKLFISLYKSAFPNVARYISKMGGSLEEAQDIFQDALVIYYEKAAASAFSVENSDKVYLIGIAKHLWLKKFKDNSLYTPIDGLEIFQQQDDQPSESRLMHFLATSGKKCMELLRSFYYDQLPLAQAASLFGFSGLRSATVQKYKCLQKVRQTVKEKSLTYADFLD